MWNYFLLIYKHLCVKYSQEFSTVVYYCFVIIIDHDYKQQNNIDNLIGNFMKIKINWFITTQNFAGAEFVVYKTLSA